MFYFLHEFKEVFSPLRVFEYITVRTVAGAGSAFVISLVLGPHVIRRLTELKIGEIIRKEEAPPIYEFHADKSGTPTMGGILIIGAASIATLLWANPTNVFIWIALATLCAMGAIGFLDDYMKLVKKPSRGLSARWKLILQTSWSAVVVIILLSRPGTAETTRQFLVPFFKTPLIEDMGALVTFLFITIILVGASNAVNLTDGLDGLAIGCSSTVAFSYLIMAYVAGHYAFSEYLNIPFVKGSGELAVFCGCLVGAGLGFLWFNCHPAAIFMGDTGSLALGGAIGMVAVLIKQELVLVIVGGVFVIEALSVILQVASFQLSGKRIFAMAPIHHHFQMKSWSETQITVRFWIVSLLFAMLGLLALKIR